jgi:hypothetical protein
MHAITTILQAMEDVSRLPDQAPSEEEPRQVQSRIQKSERLVRESSGAPEQDASNLGDVSFILTPTTARHQDKKDL